MKNIVVNNIMSFISKYNRYNDVELEELKYGIVSIYLLVTKLIVILIVSILLGIVKEMLLFTIIYIPIRAVSFGLHATKSWICLISSIIMFIGLPFLSIHLIIPTFIKSLVGIVCIVLIFKNSPADTHKRPIVNKNRRLFFKYTSTFICVIYCFMSLFINNNFISNSLLFSLMLQNCLISPTVYKIFNLPYDNYKNYKFE